MEKSQHNIEETEKPRERIEYIDTAKGIAIICVCIGHALTNQVNVHQVSMPYLLRLINQFHMPLFFAINGMLFNDKHINTPVKSIFYKVKAYYIPFVVYNLIFLIFHNLFSVLYLVNEEYHGAAYSAREYISHFFMVITGHRQSFGGAMWFLGSLMVISILFIGSQYIIHRFVPKRFHAVSTIGFVLACVVVGVLPICPKSFKLNVSLYSMLFFYLGYLYRKLNINKVLLKYKKLIIILSVIGSLIISFYSPVGVVSKNYTNFYLYVITAILGFLGVLMISQCNIVSKFALLKRIGKKSLDIMALHFLAFKLVSVVIVLLYKMDWERLAEYPVLIGVNGGWWIVYTIVGVTVPMLVRMFYDRCNTWDVKLFTNMGQHKKG